MGANQSHRSAVLFYPDLMKLFSNSHLKGIHDVIVIYTCKDNLIPLLYSGKINIYIYIYKIKLLIPGKKND